MFLEELSKIFDKLDELSETYPFASENIKMVFLLGQRQEEVFKLKKKDIKFYNTPVQVQEDDGSIENIYGEIQFRKGTTKRRNKGKIKFIFQPAEEGYGGAKFMIEDGALEEVDEIYGLHVWNYQKSGTIGIKSGD